ncbi:30S ribosomal protein s31 mitochondrial [Phtheirospermum japonicum]|uniref:30S ribosomal protein s31 mitochondrial n=1 Tax=Phtheirospermum japonicum TaxID=374723 RepID=A0A830D412_9LAMI|nr:30S ribosomal protein s31 mitochondrial [Phtheirospermum japonicum]
MVSPTAEAPILCGRGDKKTKKGKRFKGSYGNCRPKKEQKVERIKDKIKVPRSTPFQAHLIILFFVIWRCTFSMSR